MVLWALLREIQMVDRSFVQMKRYTDKTQEIWSFLWKTAIELDSPVIQLFMRPMGKPWVVVVDYREAVDISVNRQQEFDRAAFIGEVFRPIIPGNHAWVRFSSLIALQTICTAHLQP